MPTNDSAPKRTTVERLPAFPPAAPSPSDLGGSSPLPWRASLQGVDGADLRNALEHLPVDSLFILSMCRLSQACAFVGDLPSAQALYESLLPHAEHTMTAAALGGTSLCAVAHYLGLLAAVLTRWDDAVTHLECALRLNTALGNVYHAARTRYAYASVLLARNRNDDWHRARALLEEAVAAFQDLATLPSAASPHEHGPDRPGRGRVMIGEAQPRIIAQTRPPSPARPTRDYVFQPHGQYWTIVYHSPPFHLRDLRGLHYIASLLRHPNHPLHVMDLVAVGYTVDTDLGGPLAEPGLHVSRLEDCDLVLDSRARRDYRARLTELREEYDEAARNNDLGRSARLQSEMSFITEHLVAAARPGRASRNHPSPVERARVNVRNCITAAINSMGPFNDAVVRHLRSAIKTGTFCRYVPDRQIAWEL